MASLLFNKQMIEFGNAFGNAFRVPVSCSNCHTDFINDNWHYWKFCPECGEPIDNARVARNEEKDIVEEMLKVLEISFTEEYKESQNELS